MEFFRLINKRTLLLWSILLSLSLLCAQDIGLHVHNVDHGHDKHQGHVHVANEADDHAHMSVAHFAQDTTHNEHHDGLAAEVDVSPEGMLKNINIYVFAIALITFFFIFEIFFSSQQLVYFRKENRLIFHSYYSLSPPSRAPPQH